MDEQFGFRNKLATTDVIFKFINEIQIALNEKIIMGGIFCDLEKAFDSINHDILKSKLNFYGAEGKTLLWFKSYLTKSINLNQFLYFPRILLQA